MPAHPTPFRVWTCLGRALRVFGRNFVPFYVLAILITVLPEIYTQVFGLASVDPSNYAFRSAEMWILDGMVWLAGIVLLNLLSAAIVFGTTQELRGRHAGIGECVRRGLWLIVPTFLAAIVVTIVAGAGFLLLVIPGIILLMMYWLVIPVVVMERPGVFASLKRSAQLTEGVRWKLFGTILVPVAVAAVIGFAVSHVTGLGFAYTAPQHGSTVGIVVSFLINTLASAYYAVVNAVAYYDIRRSKEVVEIDRIAAVFD